MVKKRTARNIFHSARFHLGGWWGILHLLNPMCPPLEFVLHTPTLRTWCPRPPLEFVLHTPTLRTWCPPPPKILNRPLCPLLQKLLDETLIWVLFHQISASLPSSALIRKCPVNFSTSSCTQVLLHPPRPIDKPTCYNKLHAD